MEYKIIVQKIENLISRDVEEAAAKLSQQVNQELAAGWEPAGGLAVGSAGTAPYLFQAILKRR